MWGAFDRSRCGGVIDKVVTGVVWVCDSGSEELCASHVVMLFD